MATFYVDSADGADGTPNSVSWAGFGGNQDTYATITGALAAATGTGPHIIYVSHTHAHTATAAIAWDAATAGAKIRIISVNRTTAAWAAGATESVGASNNEFTIAQAARQQDLFLYGLTVNGGTNNNANCRIRIGVGIAAATSFILSFESCNIKINSAQAGAQITLGIGSGSNRQNPNIRFRNCAFQVKDNATNSAFILAGLQLEWINTTISYLGANKPTPLFDSSTSTSKELNFIDSDLSGFNTTSGAYFDLTNFDYAIIRLQNCKLSSTPSVSVNAFPTNISSLTRINADSSDTAHTLYYKTRLGDLESNTANYASDARKYGDSNGSQVSWKITTTASCNEQEPFITPWLFNWAADTSAITPSIEIVHDSATNLTDRDIWSEMEYVSSASFPQGSLDSNRNAQPYDGTTADHAAGSATWTLSPSMSNENKQKLAHSFTPAEKSTLRARVAVGVASKTLYLDPQIRGLA